MLALLQNNLATILISAALLAIVCLIITSMIQSRKRGKGSCSCGGCSGCGQSACSQNKTTHDSSPPPHGDEV